MDVVYMLSSESGIDDWELRYSLRSLEKHYKDLQRVWIIGHRPHWVKGVSHIPQADSYKSNKDANLISKIIRLGYVSELSEKFIMMMDDVIILKDCNSSDFKPYFNKDMKPMKIKAFAKNKWSQRLRRTRDVLVKNGYPARDYEGHIGYPMEKSKLWTFLNFDYGFNIGYCVYSLYYNTVDTPGIAPIDSERVRAGFYGTKPKDKEVDRKMDINLFLNFNDGGFTEHMKNKVEERFPKASRYEEPL